MVKKLSAGEIVSTSIVSAFTIAAALIWKDAISNFINLFFPPQKALLYQFIAAIIATLFVLLAIYITQRTEEEAEILLKSLKSINEKKRKKIINEIKQEAQKVEQQAQRVEQKAEELKKEASA